MRVFVTGATGFVGSAVVQELIRGGHDVLGLARSDAAAKTLEAAGAKVHRGDLENLESLRSGAEAADGVIHTGFIHDFARFKEVCAVDEKAIHVLGDVLAGSSRPLIVTSGTALVSPGTLATELMPPKPRDPMWPRVSENAAQELTARGVRVISVRLSPSVHGDGDHGFVPILINLAKEKGVSAYVGDGLNRWSGVHRLDAGLLYRLALEKAAVAGERLHGVAEEGIAFKDIATAIGKGLGVPVVSKTKDEAAAHFAWFSAFAAIDAPASSKLTQERLGWKPKEVGLIADIEKGKYFKN